jgi:hypothetical protein
MTVDFGSLDLSGLTLRSPGIEPGHHFVEFYEDDPSLTDSARTFLSMGISAGEPAVIIADAAHREAFDAALSLGIDLPAARERGLYLSVDAEETLGLFMEDDLPDPSRFDRVIRDLIERTGGKKDVRFVGEIVALLWAQGNVDGALGLEDLWNRASRRHSFRLFCAYPADSFGREDLALLGEVCDRHTHVVVPKAMAV